MTYPFSGMGSAAWYSTLLSASRQRNADFVLAHCGAEDDGGRANLAERSSSPVEDFFRSNTLTVKMPDFLLYVTMLASVPRMKVEGCGRPMSSPSSSSAGTAMSSSELRAPLSGLHRRRES